MYSHTYLYTQIHMDKQVASARAHILLACVVSAVMAEAFVQRPVFTTNSSWRLVEITFGGGGNLNISPLGNSCPCFVCSCHGACAWHNTQRCSVCERTDLTHRFRSRHVDDMLSSFTKTNPICAGVLQVALIQWRNSTGSLWAVIHRVWFGDCIVHRCWWMDGEHSFLLFIVSQVH